MGYFVIRSPQAIVVVIVILDQFLPRNLWIDDHAALTLFSALVIRQRRNKVLNRLAFVASLVVR